MTCCDLGAHEWYLNPLTIKSEMGFLALLRQGGGGGVSLFSLLFPMEEKLKGSIERETIYRSRMVVVTQCERVKEFLMR